MKKVKYLLKRFILSGKQIAPIPWLAFILNLSARAGLIRENNNIADGLPFKKMSSAKYVKQKRADYKHFLKNGTFLRASSETPVISIIFSADNGVEQNYASIKSIFEFTHLPFELIIFDSSPANKSRFLFKHLPGAKVIHDKRNRNFGVEFSRVIEDLKSEYTLFLQGGSELMENSLSTVVKAVESINNCGAAGGKIVSPEGILYETGSTIWENGCFGPYGRGESPDLPDYNFRRFTDYCRPRFFLTKTSLIKSYGDTGKLFSSINFIIADFSLWLRKHKLYVLYNPETIVRYSESNPVSSFFPGKRHKKDREIFVNKNNKQLSCHYKHHRNNIFKARHAASSKPIKRVLYVDDRVPHKSLGVGYPRANAIIHSILESGFQVTLFPVVYNDEKTWASVYQDVDSFIEVVRIGAKYSFQKFINMRDDYYDLIWVSRPHNMQTILPALNKLSKKPYIIYDAEAIYAEREFLKRRLFNQKEDEAGIKKMVEHEMQLCKTADAVITVSTSNAEKFHSHGIRNTFILSHQVDTQQTPANFNGRKGLLFVGNIEDEKSPNSDSITWFVNEVFPLIKKEIPDLVFHIVGSCKSESILALKTDGINIHGRVDDLTSFYNNCRVFVAPTRFAAGIPLKIIEAAAWGIPVVATELLREQLGWKHQEHLLASKPDKYEFAQHVTGLYNNAALWESLRTNAYRVVQSEHSRKSFDRVIKDVISQEPKLTDNH